MRYALALAALLLALPAAAAETLTFTKTPVPARAACAGATVDEMHLMRTARRVEVSLRCDSGPVLSHAWTGAEATALLRLLNTLDLSGAGNSLNARILKKLRGDGVYPGTVSGEPE